MRIDSATVGMESARSYHAQETKVRRFVITEYQAALTNNEFTDFAASEQDGEEGLQGAAENGNVQETEDERLSMYEAWQNRFGITSGRVNVSNARGHMLEDLRQVTIRYIFEMLFASRRNRFQEWMEEHGFADGTSNQGEPGMQTGSSPVAAQNPRAATIKVLNYVREDYYSETESTSFSTVGTVRTADGREISFNVEVGMSREFQEYYQEELQMASYTMCDPLVINLDTDVASLDDQKFFFDIDADGESDEISALGQGSGYLALDRNGDGIIGDGSELFGTASGNGFADLAEYDEDGNGWIDEADAVWDKLRIWCRNEQGEDVLYKLSEKGVGAICLQNVSTDFSLKGNDNRTLGAIRNSGVFLYENGNVGTVQHVDVAKYSMQA